MSYDFFESLYFAFKKMQKACTVVGEIALNLDTIIKSLSEEKQKATEKWIEYGWVPMLPNLELSELFFLNAPQSEKEAKELMLSKLQGDDLKHLYNEIRDSAKKFSLNSVTFEDAVKSFDNKCYTACSMCLFSLIDSTFIKEAPRNGKRRALARNAIKYEIPKNDYEVIAIIVTRELILQLFQDTEDFKLKYDKSLSRNMVSHGMNKRNPNKTDCLKLFVLLYNTLLMFETGMFEFKQ